MKRTVRIAIAGLYLIAAASPATAMTQAVAMAALKEQLKNPASVMLRNVRYFEVAICGEVNPKDAKGEYLGYTRFIISGSSAAPNVWVESQRPADDFRLSWNRACHAAK